ncbi:LPS export ABC transporter periplasmic protein LptC [Methylobacterium sp. C25]|uniref:LPS export ABC transporter periplasmic protein LptC n=1 Tax=Methylobacterium sp. C25 TaxID=2721622 RepID=UPI001F34B87B|nr:LPS export ABC transporter periplasmic protein LptC [Methylobacterium sp. C25]
MQAADTLDMQASAANENARRTQAHGRAVRHSARVRLLRRVIPVVAGVAIFAIVAVVWNPFSGSISNVSVGPVSVQGTKVTMENPKLSGFKKGERGYEVTADSALQDVRKPSLIELHAMKGHIATDDKGGLAYIESKGGLFDSSKESLTLNENIRLWTDKGEEARLKSASVDFKAGSVKSSETVTVSVPNGSVTADSLDVVESGKVISFIGNVHAVFQGGGKKPATEDGDAGERVRTSAAEGPKETAEAGR